MTFKPKDADHPRYKIDMSEDKYLTQYDRFLNLLFYSKEIPHDIYFRMNHMSCENYRKILSILRKRELIKSIRKDGIVSYTLTTKGKSLTKQPRYKKYADCFENDKRQYDIKHRARKWQLAKLYALFDRMGIPYESFAKPSLDMGTVLGDEVYFYTSLDFKRKWRLEVTPFVGSRLLGFLIGNCRIIPVYRTNQMLMTFGSHEVLVPEFMKRYFSVPVDSAVLICEGKRAVGDITKQIIHNIPGASNGNINTAQYKEFYVFADDDSFLDHYTDLYDDLSVIEQRIISEYNIDTSETDYSGSYRYMPGTGYIGDVPVLVFPGNVNAVELKRFIHDVRLRGYIKSLIFCRQRDVECVEAVTSGTSIITVGV